MSTSYYRPRKPFTSFRVTVGGGHTVLSIWVNHGKVGDITLRNDEVSQVLLALSRDSPAVERIGLADGGTRLDFYDDTLESEDQLISEAGALFRLADLESEALQFGFTTD